MTSLLKNVFSIYQSYKLYHCYFQMAIVIAWVLIMFLKVVDKLYFIIYNDYRKRQDLKRLCQKEFCYKNNAISFGRLALFFYGNY